VTDSSTEAPLAWNVAGLLSDAAGAERHLDVHDATIDLGEDLQRPVR